ncbi:MAG: tyrosine-type recombinase/integrase [Streptosporangiaceae bacterium]
MSVSGGQDSAESGQYRVPGGLLERLMAAVRTEFRSGELVFDPADPVFGGAICKVEACPRTARGGRGLCHGHHDRWTAQGKPDLDAFAAAPGPRWLGHAPLPGCRAPGCGRGLRGHGLCPRHSDAWDRAGRPPVDEWLAGVPATETPVGQQECLAGFCGLWAERGVPFCLSHGSAWRAAGRPEPGAFAGRYPGEDPVPDGDRIFLDSLPPQLKLEIQYALQRRHDDREGKAPPPVVMSMVRFLDSSGASSLLERTEQEWRDETGRQRGKTTALLAWSRRQVADLAEGAGWDTEYPSDIWQLHRLGFEGRNVLDFSGIPQQELKDLAKRWIRWRLSTGLGIDSGGRRPLRSLTRLAVFLQARGIAGTAGITRPVLEDYLADLHAALAGRVGHRAHVSIIGLFLTAVRQHGWAPDLPPDARLFPGDQPPRIEFLPRALAGHVMAQVEEPGNLARQANPAYRLATVILIRCGLRISDALKLPFDCTVTDDSGAPYLRYFNNKMKREALVPVDGELLELIRGQQQRILDRYPAGTVLFPRPEKNPDGKVPVAGATYRPALYRWLQHCDIRDEHGRPVHLTPHQWRHTLGTTLINRDVPQHVVQKILDHDSPLMTALYARLSDKTVREHWERARKVNAEGQTVEIRAGGPLGDAAWSKQRLSRATQSLPNGYCELPMAKTCPHANSCLTCPMFVTTAEFLPQHHAQRKHTLQIITAAEAAGHARVAEMNKQVAANLDKIITTLEDGGEENTEAAAGAS